LADITTHAAASAWRITEEVMARELASDEVRRTCDPEVINVKTTRECSPLEGIIGQRRAVEALQFGLDMPSGGFNVFVAGRPGTGKTTAVKAFLEERAKNQPTPSDWCYVNNFADPQCPKALRLPAGRGRTFRWDVRKFVELAQKEIGDAFESEQYAERRKNAQAEIEARRKALFAKMEEQAKGAGFLLQVTPMGIAYVPLIEGKPLDQQSFMALSQEVKEELEEKQKALQDDTSGTLKEIRKLAREAADRIQKMDREVAMFVLGPLVDDMMEGYGDIPEVAAHMKAIRDDMLEHIHDARHNQADAEGESVKVAGGLKRPAVKYEVNVVVDNSGGEGAPVVSELNPTYQDLFGRIEKEAQMGALRTDFTLIRAGSIHKANGGYLVLPVQEVLRNPLAWDGLKRAIRNEEIVIEELGERMGFVSTRGLQPEPIPLSVKIILIGNPMLYHLLYTQDEDFNELFKVKADFDVQMDRTEENMRDYVSFVCTLCEKEELRPLDREAAAKVVEFGSRQANDQYKLSTHFAQVADLVRETNFWAGKDDAEHAGAVHVQKAIEQKTYRSSLVQERIQEMINRGTLLIDTTAEAVGQVNGLAVISIGDNAFGRPNRITASIGMGRGGILDIEREAKLGGNIHTKGVLILSGYLVKQYAHDKPLSLSARLVFEQSYDGVDGDSASSTELYALLSALSGVPIKQGIAVTGSVNQQGEVQAIGGVNEKIEGFYEVCKAKGLTGDQGVMIPESNVKNLMLKEDVVKAVSDGHFHIWPVKTINEGIEVLTGVPAGSRGDDGLFSEGSVHARVDRRLRDLAERIRSFGRDEKSGTKDEDGE
jgi:lon-related putative ATP-dependent protease